MPNTHTKPTRSITQSVTKTCSNPALGVARIVAGLPLLAFGLMHLSGAAPMKPLLEAAGLPLVDVNAVLAPVAQVLAGALLIGGFYARVGAAIAIGTMLGAIYTHIQIPSDAWPTTNGGPEEPPLIFVAIAVAVLSVWVLVGGAGRWSIDGKQPSHPEPATA